MLVLKIRRLRDIITLGFMKTNANLFYNKLFYYIIYNKICQLQRESILERMIKKLERILRHGFNDIVTFIDLTITNMEDIEDKMQRHTQSALDDYKGAQLGVEIRPAIRNNTTRNTDAIVRPPRTTRARALTRRTRSF